MSYIENIIVFEFIFIWYRNYYIFFYNVILELDYRVSLHFFQDVQYFIILTYFSIVILNFVYLLSISCWIDGCWGKKFKISTQKCSLFLSIILFCPLVKICFHFPFLSVKAIMFNHIIIYIIWNYILLVTHLL